MTEGQVGVVDVWQNIADYLGHIPGLFNVFALDVLYEHPRMQQVMDNSSSCKVNARCLNIQLVCLANPRLS